jgi:hypothetical protein
VGSGQPTEIKTKNLGNIGLNIEQTWGNLMKKIHPEGLARVWRQW